MGLRYFLCLFPNTGLMFCLQVVLQYERKGGELDCPLREKISKKWYCWFVVSGANFSTLYSNLFSYQLYIGLCLLLMLIYSVILFFLAIYVERVNPGEFGIAQPWYYLFKKSYWKPQVSASVQPFDEKFQKHRASLANDAQNHWVEVKGRPGSAGEESASLMISHVTKVRSSLFKSASTILFHMHSFRNLANLLLCQIYHWISTKVKYAHCWDTMVLAKQRRPSCLSVCIIRNPRDHSFEYQHDLIVGMLDATSGYISVEGINIQSNIQTVRKILGFCPQYGKIHSRKYLKVLTWSSSMYDWLDILYDDLSVEEHLTLIGKVGVDNEWFSDPIRQD